VVDPFYSREFLFEMAKVLLLQIGNDHIKIVLGVGLTHFDRTVNMGFELFKAFLFLYNKCSVSTEKIHYKQGLHGSCRVYNMKTVCKQFDIIGGIGDNEYGIICRHEGFEIKRIHLMHLQPLIRDMIFSNKVIEQYGIDTLLFEIDILDACFMTSSVVFESIISPLLERSKRIIGTTWSFSLLACIYSYCVDVIISTERV